MSRAAGSALTRALEALGSPAGRLDEGAAAEAAALSDRLTKPRGALGRLEAIGERLAAIARRCPPPVPQPAVVAVFAADHGVWAEGVSSWPQEVTAQMVANLCAGGAAINVLARQGGARVVVVDVGVATPVDGAPGLVSRPVRSGTANLAVGPAMDIAEARAAMEIGAEVALEAVAAGASALVTGDMGIANTTASAAVVAALTGLAPAALVGRGTGIDEATLARKTAIVEGAVGRASLGDLGPVGVVAEVGGLEIAALAGFVLGGAAARVPVVLDGVIALAGTLAAAALAPEASGFCFAGHRSPEPAASAALDHLGLEPILDLGMRLGEGTGACLALPVLTAAARVLSEMATFDAAGVSEKEA